MRSTLRTAWAAANNAIDGNVAATTPAASSSSRLLRFNPAFAAAAILSLALGIGANTAIFQLLNAIRLRTLPVKNPQELAEVRIAERNGATGSFVTRYPNLTNPH